MKTRTHRKSHKGKKTPGKGKADEVLDGVADRSAAPFATEPTLPTEPLWDASPAALATSLMQEAEPGPQVAEPSSDANAPVLAPPIPKPASAAQYEASPRAEHAARAAPPRPDFDALARNMGLLLEQGGKLASTWLAPREKGGTTADSYAGMVQVFGQVADHWLAQPARLAEAQAELSSRFIDLWADSLRRFSGAPPGREDPDAARDKRFADPEWRENPFFDFVRRAYLIGAGWARDMVEGAESLDEPTRLKARFLMRQVASALSPSNFIVTNPEVLRETWNENGANLVRGLGFLAEDVAAGGGDLRIRQTDESRFELGVNVAVTPGKVVFRNDLIELLQYAPRTDAVVKRPLLVVPPWINKFYILDLNPAKSFVGYAVSRGFTVFMLSWVNPDARHAAKGWDAYLDEGVYAALDAVTVATGETDVATLGYCVGGTLLAAGLAHMAARGDTRVSSASFLTTQVDFAHAGDLKVFADPAHVAAVEAEMAATGFLQGAKMAQAFNMLRPDDLIWSYVVNNYLKGQEPPPFDLLAWNADATRMAAANHSFYLRECYGANALATGRMVLGGEALDLGRVRVPVYNLATREDHIAPARSVFEGSRRFGGPVRTVVAGSGHIAGVINAPGKAKYGYWSGPASTGGFDDWLADATHTPGSWWPDWADWLLAQAPATVPARHPGEGGLAVLGDAPGTYVRVKS